MEFFLKEGNLWEVISAPMLSTSYLVLLILG